MKLASGLANKGLGSELRLMAGKGTPPGGKLAAKIILLPPLGDNLRIAFLEAFIEGHAAVPRMLIIALEFSVAVEARDLWSHIVNYSPRNGENVTDGFSTLEGDRAE